jgi:hypothetical protein
LYIKGQGVHKDYREAAHWYQLAAEAQVTSAQDKLGVMYEYGRGTVQDYVSAYVWYSRAASQGNPDAKGHLDALIKKMDSSQIELARERLKGKM